MRQLPYCLAALTATALSLPAQAALYSTTKVEALYGWDYEDQADAGFGIDNRRHGILTIANASGWTYADSFFFADFTNYDRGTEEEQDYGSTHAEFNVRGNIGKVARTGSVLRSREQRLPERPDRPGPQLRHPQDHSYGGAWRGSRRAGLSLLQGTGHVPRR